MWDLPGPGIEPLSPALAGGFLTTAPPGKSQTCSLYVLKEICSPWRHLSEVISQIWCFDFPFSQLGKRGKAKHGTWSIRPKNCIFRQCIISPWGPGTNSSFQWLVMSRCASLSSCDEMIILTSCLSYMAGVAVLGLWQYHSNLLLCCHRAFSLHDSLYPDFPLLMGTLVIGWGSTLNQSGLILTWLHLPKGHIHRFWVHVNLEGMLLNPVKYLLSARHVLSTFIP